MGIDTKIKFISSLLADIMRYFNVINTILMTNGSHIGKQNGGYKILNDVAIFGFLDPENIGIDTKHQVRIFIISPI